MKKIICYFLLLSVIVSGCTKGFDELNTDPNRPSLSNPAVAAGAANALFSSAVSRGLMEAFEFQRVQSLYADLYAQYYANSATYFASDQYQINQTWLNEGWTRFYPRDIKNLVDIINSPYATNNQKQIARIWKVFLFHRMVDFYGDIPYFDAGNPDKPEKFDNQKDIYYDMFKELNDAVVAMDAGGSFDTKDVIYAGNTTNWKKFANTLRLRLAIRVTKADPAKAKTEAEVAIASGIFASNTDNALARVNNLLPNALNQITGFNEFRMSATMESVMTGYKDPRTAQYFSPAAGASGNPVYAGKYNGIVNGTSAANLALEENKFDNNSNVGPRFSRTQMNDNPRIVLTYAEACFLMAEAALRGYNGATNAKDWYEKGITASMNQFGVTPATAVTSYISNTTDIPTTPALATRPIATLPVAFASVADQQLEQIQIQKWLAVYPDGFEGWANFRRTGFPRFYRPANYDPSSDVTVGNFIQRLPYTDFMRSLNAQGVSAAENRMGGKGQSVSLWFAGGK